MLFACFTASGKTISYAYDAAGNRIKRQIVLQSRATESVDTTFFISENLVKKEIKIYPNPTKGHLKIQISNYENDNDCTFKLYDMSGKCLLAIKGEGEFNIIDISSFTPSLYMLEIEIGEEKSMWKIIKE